MADHGYEMTLCTALPLHDVAFHADLIAGERETSTERIHSFIHLSAPLFGMLDGAGPAAAVC